MKRQIKFPHEKRELKPPPPVDISQIPIDVLFLIFNQSGDCYSVFPFLFVSKSYHEIAKLFLKKYPNKDKYGYGLPSLFSFYSCRIGNLNLLNWLKSIKCLYTIKIFNVLAANGELEILKWAIELFKKRDSIFEKDYSLENKHHTVTQRKIYSILGKIIYNAAINNRLKIIDYIYYAYYDEESTIITTGNRKKNNQIKNSFIMNVVNGAAKGNHFELFSKYYSSKDNFWVDINDPNEKDQLLLKRIAKYADISIMNFYINQRMELDGGGLHHHKVMDIFTLGFIHNRVDLLDWIVYEKKYVNVDFIFKKKLFDVRQFDLKKRCRKDMKSAIERESLDSLKWALKNNLFSKELDGPILFQVAAINWKKNILVWLQENNMHYDDSTTMGVIWGRKDIGWESNPMKNRFKFNQFILSSIKTTGNYNISVEEIKDRLEYVHNMGHPVSVWTSANAAATGNLELLKWIHQNGLPIADSSYIFAIWYNQLNTVQWLTEQHLTPPLNIIVNTFTIENNKQIYDKKKIMSRKKFYKHWVNEIMVNGL